MPRVAGVDPGTVSFDLCVLEDGETVVEQVFETGSLTRDSRPLLEALSHHGPYALVYGPSGYGLPLVAAADVGESELAEMVLVRPDEARAEAGIGGMRSLLRSLALSGLPVIALLSGPGEHVRARRCAAGGCPDRWSACRPDRGAEAARSERHRT